MRRWSAILVLASAATAGTALDQTDPADVARAVLSAYASRDLATLSRLATPENQGIIAEIARDRQAHPRYQSPGRIGPPVSVGHGSACGRAMLSALEEPRPPARPCARTPGCGRGRLGIEPLAALDRLAGTPAASAPCQSLA
jgi:DNA-binding IclR family transcriptional regulator